MGACIALVPSTARADLALTYYMDSTELHYDHNTMGLSIEDGIGSVFELLLSDTTAFTVVDSSRLSSTSGNVKVDLQLVRNGANDYSATGVFEVTDASGSVAILADFVSTGISLSGGMLEIQGQITAQGGPGSTILVNKGDSPWLFEGDSEHPTFLQGEDLAVGNALSYGNGVLTTVSFGLGGVTLDGFFNAGANRDLYQGTLQGQIVPLPGALLLGAIGLAVLVGVRRRFG